MIHDPFYKRLLGNERVIRELIEAFIAPTRPPAWLEALDFDTLERGPTENVTDAGRRRTEDMIWSVGQAAGDGAGRRVHLLVEHQSSVDHAMALRFLDYTSLLFQRLYPDDRRRRWRKDDAADETLRVVVYNGDRQWDAHTNLAGAVVAGDPLELVYHLVDLARLPGDDPQCRRVLSWVARLECAARAGLPGLVSDLGRWLAGEDELELTKIFDTRVEALGRRWGLELPSLRRYREGSDMLEERLDREEAELHGQWRAKWRAEALEEGREQGREQEKALLRRQATRRFGPEAAARLTAALHGVRDADRLTEAGDWIVDSVDAADFFSRLENNGG